MRAALVQTRVSDYKDEQWQRAFRHAEKTRKAALGLSADERRKLYEKANEEFAEEAVGDARRQLAELLLDLSVASPLTFKMNPNL